MGFIPVSVSLLSSIFTPDMSHFILAVNCQKHFMFSFTSLSSLIVIDHLHLFCWLSVFKWWCLQFMKDSGINLLFNLMNFIILHLDFVILQSDNSLNKDSPLLHLPLVFNCAKTAFSHYKNT